MASRSRPVLRCTSNWVMVAAFSQKRIISEPLYQAQGNELALYEAAHEVRYLHIKGYAEHWNDEATLPRLARKTGRAQLTKVGGAKVRKTAFPTWKIHRIVPESAQIPGQ